MTSHPNRSKVRYFKVCPNGYSNQVLYFRVPLDKIAEVNAYFAHYEDDVERGGYCNWTEDSAAKIPGVAVNWEDRARVNF